MKKINAFIALSVFAAALAVSGCQKNETPAQAPQSAPTGTLSAPTTTAAAAEHK